MITTLDVKCPHCEQVSQIFLSTSVSVIILNCPSCFSPVMYFRHKIFLLDQQQLRKITENSHTTAVFKLIEQMDGVKATASCVAKKAAHCSENSGRSAPLTRYAIDQPEEKYITGDDCTNLRIELELCSDSQQFIDRI